jgi:hypothetical protein
MRDPVTLDGQARFLGEGRAQPGRHTQAGRRCGLDPPHAHSRGSIRSLVWGRDTLRASALILFNRHPVCIRTYIEPPGMRPGTAGRSRAGVAPRRQANRPVPPQSGGHAAALPHHPRHPLPAERFHRLLRRHAQGGGDRPRRRAAAAAGGGGRAGTRARADLAHACAHRPCRRRRRAGAHARPAHRRPAPGRPVLDRRAGGAEPAVRLCAGRALHAHALAGRRRPGHGG